jgi:sugar/nucleoside kinase (ribokinase family)
VRFVALGEVMVDVVCDELPAAGERVHTSVAVRAGGSAVNAALWAAELGASACVVGRIGSDPAGELVRNRLSARGIEARLAQDDELPTGTAVALGVEQAAGFVADRGANARLSEDDVPDPLTGDALLVSGFALFQAGSADAASTGLRRFTGGWAGVDVGSSRLAATADLERASGANVVFATAEEAEALTGAEPEEAAHELATRFTVASVKLGKNGALAARGEVVERAAPPQVTPNATFGSGDAFAAAFLLALAGGDDLLPALERACESGARWSGASSRC